MTLPFCTRPLRPARAHIRYHVRTSRLRSGSASVKPGSSRSATSGPSSFIPRVSCLSKPALFKPRSLHSLSSSSQSLDSWKPLKLPDMIEIEGTSSPNEVMRIGAILPGVSPVREDTPRATTQAGPEAEHEEEPTRVSFDSSSSGQSDAAYQSLKSQKGPELAESAAAQRNTELETLQDQQTPITNKTVPNAIHPITEIPPDEPEPPRVAECHTVDSKTPKLEPPVSEELVKEESKPKRPVSQASEVTEPKKEAPKIDTPKAPTSQEQTTTETESSKAPKIELSKPKAAKTKLSTSELEEAGSPDPRTKKPSSIHNVAPIEAISPLETLIKTVLSKRDRKRFAEAARQAEKSREKVAKAAHADKAEREKAEQEAAETAQKVTELRKRAEQKAAKREAKALAKSQDEETRPTKRIQAERAENPASATAQFQPIMAAPARTESEKAALAKRAKSVLDKEKLVETAEVERNNVGEAGLAKAELAKAELAKTEATRAELEALIEEDEAAGAEDTGLQLGRLKRAAMRHAGRRNDKPEFEVPKELLQYASIPIPPLRAFYLPFMTQHRILLRMQNICEHMCFRWVQRELPDVIDSGFKWEVECAESLELPQYTRLMAANAVKFSTEDFARLPKSLPAVLITMEHVRHLAVHRDRVSTQLIEQLNAEMEALAIFLKDEEASAFFKRLGEEARRTTASLEANKNKVEGRLLEVVKDLAAQRAELDRQERGAIDVMLTDEKRFKESAAMSLGKVVEPVEEKKEPEPPQQHGLLARTFGWIKTIF